MIQVRAKKPRLVSIGAVFRNDPFSAEGKNKPNKGVRDDVAHRRYVKPNKLLHSTGRATVG
jgi:hypothetical protein